MITAALTASEGRVETLDRYSVSDFLPSSSVLCRNTAPLITFAFSLLRRGVACHVVGRDIQVGLEKLVDKTKGDSLASFRINLISNRNKECQKLRSKGKRQAAENYNDKIEALLVIASTCQDVAQVKTKIQVLFKDGPGVTLSTIHKSKGLEWPTIFLLDWHLVPSPYAEQDWEKRQERNLQYVAVTRAKENIKYIKTNNWKEPS